MDLPAPLIESARAAYGVPPRAYHSWTHIEEVRRRYDEVAAGPGWERPREVLLAVVFHDAVYVAGQKDNEDRSADVAVAEIARHFEDGAVDAARVAELIRLTARHGSLTPGDVDPEAALFLDCDMAILGAEPERFAEYERAIALEYAHVPPALYRQGRGRFLQKLLASPRIYHSELFLTRLEQRARVNLTRALESLD